jgi:hypothetical protein
MDKTILKAVFLCILLIIPILPVYICPVKAQTANLTFHDDFDGTVIDTSKWDVQQNVNNGVGGRKTVSGSPVSFPREETSFPCITTKENPFPNSGDFSLELNIQYLSITERGCGFWVSSVPYIISSSSGIIYLASIADVLLVFSDTTFGPSMFLLGKPLAFSSSLTSYVLLRLDYTNGTYLLYLNGVLQVSVKSELRPQFMGFGHPQAPYVPLLTSTDWTSFKIDSISVFQISPVTPTITPEPSTTQKPSESWIITLTGIILAIIILAIATLLLYHAVKATQKVNKKG